MIRILGALIVAAACGGLGIRKAQLLSARVRALEALSSAMEQLERELSLRLTPLPQLMQEMKERTEPPARALFEGCQTALEGLEHERFSHAWRRLVDALPNLKEEDRRTLAPLGQVLGRYDGRGQASAIAAVRQELEELAQRAREDSRRLGRVYRAVGVAGGGFLVVLLL